MFIKKNGGTAFGQVWEILFPEGNGHVRISQDFFGEKKEMFSVMVETSPLKDPDMYIRFRNDGTIHSVIMDRSIKRIDPDSMEPDEWLIERDGA